MSKYKLISFDMDGTLLNSNKEILPKSLELIQQAVDSGKEVILSTGRRKFYNENSYPVGKFNIYYVTPEARDGNKEKIHIKNFPTIYQSGEVFI